MRTFATATALLLVAINVIGFSNVAAEDCVVESADPASYIFVDPYYVEDRDGAGVPGSGLIVGSGTWIYEETNGIPGLQRGGEMGLGADPIQDETCGAGPDKLIL